MVKKVAAALGIFVGVGVTFAQAPPPLPVFESPTVKATCLWDSANNLYRYSYAITNPASNTVRLQDISLPIGPWTDVSVAPIPPVQWRNWFVARVSGGGGIRAPLEPHINWALNQFHPGATYRDFAFSSSRPPSIRELWLEPNLHWYFQDWLEATGEEELDGDVIQPFERSYVRKVPTLGPLPEQPGSFQHFDTLLGDVERAHGLGWITDGSLAGLIKQKLSEARAAAVAQDFVHMHEKLQQVIAAMEAAPASARRQEAYDLVVLNAKYLDQSLPWPCDPKLVLEPLEQAHSLGEEAEVRARVWNAATGSPLHDVALTMAVKEGPHVGLAHTGQTDAQGQLVFRYRGNQLGTDTVGIEPPEASEASVAAQAPTSVAQRREEQNRFLLEYFESKIQEVKRMRHLSAEEIARERQDIKEALEQTAKLGVSEQDRKRALSYVQAVFEVLGIPVQMEPPRKPLQVSSQATLDTCGYWIDSTATTQVHWTGGADLLVESFIPQLLISEPGKTFYVTERTVNRGNIPAPATVTRYYLSTQRPVDLSQAKVVGQRDIPPLAPGEESGVRLVPFTVPAGLPPGTYYLDACADAEGNVTELSETNNCASSQLHMVTYAMPPNRPPVCSTAVAEPSVLWPPNHKLVEVSIGGVSDPDGDAVTLSITGVTQDEPTEGLGDGDVCPDAEVTGNGKVRLRAERSGLGNGRVYVVSFTASDGKGGSCSGSVRVAVPHDQSRQPVDDGQRYDATACPGQGPQR